MKHRRALVLGAALMLLSFAGFSCSRYDTNPAEVPDPAHDEVLAAAPAEAAHAADAARGVDDAVMSTPVDPDPARHYRTVVLAGGCFWCVEAVYEQLDGVIDAESGYSGGAAETANYKAVSTGTTGHAEAVLITYDPSRITYGQILKVFFTTAHNPTTLNRQGADVGTQYRSAIFYQSEEQRRIAEDYIKQLHEAGVYSSPIVTKLEKFELFYPAEDYHQDYARQNPNQSYIRGVSTPKVEKTREAYPELLRDGQAAE